jgi:hypothetical protein
MDDITKNYRFQRILHEAAQYRVLRRIIDSDRDYETTPPSVDYRRPDSGCDDEQRR